MALVGIEVVRSGSEDGEVGSLVGGLESWLVSGIYERRVSFTEWILSRRTTSQHHQRFEPWYRFSNQ